MTEQILTEELKSLNQKIEQSQNTFFSLLGAKKEVEKLLEILLKEKTKPSEVSPEETKPENEKEGENAQHPDKSE